MGDAGVWRNDSLECDIGFNGVILNNVDALLLDEIMQILQDVKPNIHEEDRFVRWRHKHGLSIKDCYNRILEFSNFGNLVDLFKTKAFVCLWKYKLPRKILIFGWRLILNKLPTRGLS